MLIGKNLKLISWFLILLIISIGLSVSLQSALATWVGPTLAPPDGNVAQPINSGSTGQYIQGGLILNTSGGTNGLIVQYGKVGVGTIIPTGKLTLDAGQIVVQRGNTDNGLFALTKLNSQGVAWSTISGLPSVILQGGAADRPEISWYRGSRTYPEASIRQHTTADTGLTFWTGSGLVVPTAKMSILSGGNVGIGTTNPGAKLEVAGQVKITGGAPGANKVLTSNDVGLATWQTPASGISGTGAINYLPKWTSSSALGNSLITDSGSNIGIGGAGTSRLHIFNGFDWGADLSLDATQDGGSRWLLISTTGYATEGTNKFLIKDNTNGVRMAIDSSGNLGVGTASPGAKLEVSGQVKITGGTPGLGKVLTSDANGLATWQTPSAVSDIWVNTAGDSMTGHLIVDGNVSFKRALCPRFTFDTNQRMGRKSWETPTAYGLYENFLTQHGLRVDEATANADEYLYFTSCVENSDGTVTFNQPYLKEAGSANDMYSKALSNDGNFLAGSVRAFSFKSGDSNLYKVSALGDSAFCEEFGLIMQSSAILSYGDTPPAIWIGGPINGYVTFSVNQWLIINTSILDSISLLETVTCRHP